MLDLISMSRAGDQGKELIPGDQKTESERANMEYKSQGRLRSGTVTVRAR